MTHMFVNYVDINLHICLSIIVMLNIIAYILLRDDACAKNVVFHFHKNLALLDIRKKVASVKNWQNGFVVSVDNPSLKYHIFINIFIKLVILLSSTISL